MGVTAEQLAAAIAAQQLSAPSQMDEPVYDWRDRRWEMDLWKQNNWRDRARASGPRGALGVQGPCGAVGQPGHPNDYVPLIMGCQFCGADADWHETYIDELDVRHAHLCNRHYFDGTLFQMVSLTTRVTWILSEETRTGSLIHLGLGGAQWANWALSRAIDNRAYVQRMEPGAKRDLLDQWATTGMDKAKRLLDPAPGRPRKGSNN